MGSDKAKEEQAQIKPSPSKKTFLQEQKKTKTKSALTIKQRNVSTEKETLHHENRFELLQALSDDSPYTARG